MESAESSFRMCLDEKILIPVNSWLESVYPKSAHNICSFDLNENDAPESSSPLTSKLLKEKRTFLTQTKSFIKASPSMQQLFLKNHDIFSLGRHDIGKCDMASHKIYPKDDAPVYNKQFRILEAHCKVLLEHLTNWPKLRIVSPSRSRYNSPIFCVLKKDGSLQPVLN